jgi:CheY-like chemotaxis protein
VSFESLSPIDDHLTVLPSFPRQWNRSASWHGLAVGTNERHYSSIVICAGDYIGQPSVIVCTSSLTETAMSSAGEYPSSPPPPLRRPSRSVLDYETDDSLRRALLTIDEEPVEQTATTTTSCINPSTRFGSEDPPYSTQLDWVLPDGYDPETTEAQSMKEELQRLQVLKSYLVLDAKREAAFERITAIACRAFNVPIALVSLLDLGRQWFMSNRGLGDTRETPRKLAFCAHAIQSFTNHLIVKDASKDARFKDNPLVTGPPDIRFYAGVSLISPEGYKLGTLCIIDRKPWPAGLTDDQLFTLRDLADMTVEALVNRRHRLQNIEHPAHLIAYTANDLMQPLTGVQLSLGLLKEDDALCERLDSQQHELLNTASTCCDLMVRICEGAISSLRPPEVTCQSSDPCATATAASFEPLKRKVSSALPEESSTLPLLAVTQLNDLIQNLHLILEPTPKHVPLILKLDPNCPKTILCDDLKLFRSALNLLSNAARRTLTGSIVFTISKTVDVRHLTLCGAPRQDDKQEDAYVLFECEDTAPDVSPDQYPHLFQPCHPQDGNFLLSLSSVASLISSIDGSYGFKPKDNRMGSTFWFRVPLVLPCDTPMTCNDVVRRYLRKDPIILRRPSGCAVATTLGQKPAELRGASNAPDDDDNRLRTVIRKCASGTSISSMRPIPLVVQDERQAEIVQSSCLGALFDTTVQHRRNASEPPSIQPPDFIAHATAAVENINTEPAPSLHPTSSTLPAAPLANAQPSVAATAIEVSSAGHHRVKRALVVDDSLVVRKSLAMALKRIGYDVAQAENGMEGLQKMMDIMFDLVLCDFLMPVMDGFDCVKQFRLWETENRSNFRQLIVGISAHADKGVAGQGLEAGMDDFIPKPIGIKILKELDGSLAVRQSSTALDTILVAMSASTVPFPEDQHQASGEPSYFTVSSHEDQHRDSYLRSETSRSLEMLQPTSSLAMRMVKRARVNSFSHESAASWVTSEQNPRHRDLSSGLMTTSTATVPNSFNKVLACLIATDRPTRTSNQVLMKLEAQGWKVVIVNDGANALRMLQTRNWDAVLMDSDLPDGLSSMEEFRTWEHDNRVNRQKNTFYVSVADIPSPADATSIVQAPSGFDYVLHKPVVWKDLKYLLDRDSTMGIVLKSTSK